MNDLERRALLGDKKAQAECTAKGIALTCPCCGGPAIGCLEVPQMPKAKPKVPPVIQRCSCGASEEVGG